MRRARCASATRTAGQVDRGWAGARIAALLRRRRLGASEREQRAILDERTALPAVASAVTINPPRERLVSVTGTTDISSITPHEGGYVMARTFAGVLKVLDGGGNLRLAGDFTTTGGDVLTLVSDGTNWHEVARSVN